MLSPGTYYLTLWNTTDLTQSFWYGTDGSSALALDSGVVRHADHVGIEPAPYVPATDFFVHGTHKDFIVTGTETVPEPSCLILFGVTFYGLFLFGRSLA